VPIDGRVLDDHELAARLSFFLTDSPPDAELRAAAEQGRLAQPAELSRQAERLFDGPMGEAVAWRFVSEWLDIRDLEEKPLDETFDAELEAAMLEETRRFVDHVLHEDHGAVRAG
jgi:hypothetical protein